VAADAKWAIRVLVAIGDPAPNLSPNAGGLANERGRRRVLVPGIHQRPEAVAGTGLAALGQLGEDIAPCPITEGHFDNPQDLAAAVMTLAGSHHAGDGVYRYPQGVVAGALAAFDPGSYFDDIVLSADPGDCRTESAFILLFKQLMDRQLLSFIHQSSSSFLCRYFYHLDPAWTAVNL
jgi:hypothetical protein